MCIVLNALITGELEAELPNKNLYDFTGNLTQDGFETNPIGPNEVRFKIGFAQYATNDSVDHYHFVTFFLKMVIFHVSITDDWRNQLKTFGQVHRAQCPLWAAIGTGIRTGNSRISKQGNIGSKNCAKIKTRLYPKIQVGGKTYLQQLRSFQSWPKPKPKCKFHI